MESRPDDHAGFALRPSAHIGDGRWAVGDGRWAMGARPCPGRGVRHLAWRTPVSRAVPSARKPHRRRRSPSGVTGPPRNPPTPRRRCGFPARGTEGDRRDAWRRGQRGPTLRRIRMQAPGFGPYRRWAMGGRRWAVGDGRRPCPGRGVRRLAWRTPVSRAVPSARKPHRRRRSPSGVTGPPRNPPTPRRRCGFPARGTEGDRRDAWRRGQRGHPFAPRHLSLVPRAAVYRVGPIGITCTASRSASESR